MAVSGSYSGPILAGTTTVTTTAKVLTSDTPVRGVHINSATANGAILKIGDSATQAFELDAGEFFYLVTNNLANVWIDSASGTLTVNWIAEL